MADQPDPHAEGAEACLDGLPESANPYDLATQELDHLSWNDGWNTIAEGNYDE